MLDKRICDPIYVLVPCLLDSSNRLVEALLPRHLISHKLTSNAKLPRSASSLTAEIEECIEKETYAFCALIKLTPTLDWTSKVSFGGYSQLKRAPKAKLSPAKRSRYGLSVGAPGVRS